MNETKMSDVEKKEIIKDILGTNHNAVGKHFSIFSEMMDGVGMLNDVLSFAELIPALNTWLSGSIVAPIASVASFSGVMLLFPFQQMINLINANETGLRGYSYRAISYTITAWTFDEPRPISSPTILFNITTGPYTSTKDSDRYDKIWMETSISVITKLEQVCLQEKINKLHLKTAFKALGQGSPTNLSLMILKGFEKEFSHVTQHIWASNYSITFPQ